MLENKKKEGTGWEGGGNPQQSCGIKKIFMNKYFYKKRRLEVYYFIFDPSFFCFT